MVKRFVQEGGVTAGRTRAKLPNAFTKMKTPVAIGDDQGRVMDQVNYERVGISFGNETALIYPWQIVIEAR
jgi:hypothetical protein